MYNTENLSEKMIVQVSLGIEFEKSKTISTHIYGTKKEKGKERNLNN